MICMLVRDFREHDRTVGNYLVSSAGLASSVAVGAGAAAAAAAAGTGSSAGLAASAAGAGAPSVVVVAGAAAAASSLFGSSEIGAGASTAGADAGSAVQIRHQQVSVVRGGIIMFDLPAGAASVFAGSVAAAVAAAAGAASVGLLFFSFFLKMALNLAFKLLSALGAVGMKCMVSNDTAVDGKQWSKRGREHAMPRNDGNRSLQA